MRCGSFILATLLTLSGLAVSGLSGSSTALAFCEGGQQPAPPAVAARMALPACGFAATKRWGPNGCQLCDARNMYPNPFAEHDGAYAGRRGPNRAANTW